MEWSEFLARAHRAHDPRGGGGRPSVRLTLPPNAGNDLGAGGSRLPVLGQSAILCPWLTETSLVAHWSRAAPTLSRASIETGVARRDPRTSGATPSAPWSPPRSLSTKDPSVTIWALRRLTTGSRDWFPVTVGVSPLPTGSVRITTGWRHSWSLPQRMREHSRSCLSRSFVSMPWTYLSDQAISRADLDRAPECRLSSDQEHPRLPTS